CSSDGGSNTNYIF
nr:immunoglobulin light chain junction region [Macaca mulatta]